MLCGHVSWPAVGMFRDLLWVCFMTLCGSVLWPAVDMFHDLLWSCFVTCCEHVSWPIVGMFHDLLWACFVCCYGHVEWLARGMFCDPLWACFVTCYGHVFDKFCFLRQNYVVSSLWISPEPMSPLGMLSGGSFLSEGRVKINLGETRVLGGRKDKCRQIF